MLVTLGRGLRPHQCLGEPWLPAAINSLIGWYDPSDTATITATGSSIDQIDDKSGADNHMQSTGNNRPFTGTATINSLNVIDFDISVWPKWLSLSGLTTGTLLPSGFSAQDSALAFVFEQEGSTTNNGAPLSVHNSIGGDMFAPDFVGLDQMYLPDAAGTWFVTESPSPAPRGTAYQVLLNFTDSDIECWIDGTLVLSAGDGAASNFVDRLVFGYRTSTNKPWNGRIGEICVFDSALDATQRGALSSYFAGKWGL